MWKLPLLTTRSEHPEAEVIGNDMSPIQPSCYGELRPNPSLCSKPMYMKSRIDNKIKYRTPPNSRFEIDDFEQPWQYSRRFDFIHGRELLGAVGDWEWLLRQAFENLNPSGYLEIASIEIDVLSDDGSHLEAKNFCLQRSSYMKHLRSSKNRSRL